MLECPENTPKSVYKLMTMCWSSSPSNRPCFRSESIFSFTADADADAGEKLQGSQLHTVEFVDSLNLLTPKFRSRFTMAMILMTQLWSLAVYTDADATIYNAESEPDAYFLLIQDPPPGAGHDRGRDCVDTEALTLAAFYPSVTQVFCIEASLLQHQPNGFPCFRLLSKATDLIPKKTNKDALNQVKQSIFLSS